MLALVRSRGGAAEATRRVVSRQRLGQDWEVAQALAGRRLLSVGRAESKAEETAEIAHEALIREWPTFASWVNDDADFQHWLASVEERAADGELLPDTRLAEADRWLTERATDIPHEVTQLVQDSKSEWQRRVTELENARNRAEQAAREAEARRLAAAAELALTSRQTSLQVPIALAVESLRTAPVLEADTAARHAIRTAARQICRLDHGSSVSAVAFSPDGTRVATGSGDRQRAGVRRGDRRRDRPPGPRRRGVRGGVQPGRHPGGHRQRRSAARGCSTRRPARRSPAWTTTAAVSTRWRSARTAPGWPPAAAMATAIGSARVFDAATGAEICPPGPRRPRCTRWRSARTGPGWPPAATIGSARVFDAATGAEICPPGPRRRRCTRWRSARTAPGWPPAAAIAAAGSARVFDAATGTEIARLDHDGGVSAVAFSPDGTRVATGSGDRQRAGVRRGDRRGDRPPGPRRPVSAVAFSPDGTRVATGSGDGSAQVWWADHDQLIDQAVGRLTRNLTQQEWRRYFRDEPYRKTRG